MNSSVSLGAANNLLGLRMSIDEFNDIFEDLLPQDVKVEEPVSIDKMVINIVKDHKDKFDTIGIKNVFIIEFDTKLGPKLKFFTHRDDILEKMLVNPAYVAEITIFAKYANEVLLKDGRRLVIREILIGNKQYYVFVEVGKGFMSLKPLRFVKHVTESLSRSGEISKESVKKAIERGLKLIFRSAFNKII